MSAMARAAIEMNPSLDLAELRSLSFAELEALYRAGKRPATIGDLDGDAVGAMLAWRAPRRGPLAWWLRTFGASSAFPWQGKSFRSHTKESGEGINRVTFFGKRRWFPFQTRFEPSFLDGKPAFRLDYSGPANPPFIRSIVDEVREVTPGLYLGPAAFLFRGKPRTMLFFAVSLNEAGVTR
jgi:hypothetical protein